MQLDITPVTISLFTHNAEASLLLVEISDLGANPFKQLYDDACDEGLALYNRRTGSTTYWHISAEVRKQDEITMWILQPTSASCKAHPGVQNYVMHVLND